MKQQKKKHTSSTHGATSHVRLLWRTSPDKKHSSGIYLFPQYLLVLSRYHKRQANTTQEQSQLKFCIDCSHTCLNTTGQMQHSMGLLTGWCSRIIKNLIQLRQLQYTSEGFFHRQTSKYKRENCILEVNLL